MMIQQITDDYRWNLFRQLCFGTKNNDDALPSSVIFDLAVRSVASAVVQNKRRVSWLRDLMSIIIIIIKRLHNPCTLWVLRFWTMSELLFSSAHKDLTVSISINNVTDHGHWYFHPNALICIALIFFFFC